MSEEQLRALGEKLSIKNAKKLSMEDLGFAILDEEARIESQKPVEEKTRTKRGQTCADGETDGTETCRADFHNHQNDGGNKPELIHFHSVMF